MPMRPIHWVMLFGGGNTEVESFDEGAGPYATLSVPIPVAFDNIAEFDDWVAQVRATVAIAVGKGE